MGGLISISITDAEFQGTMTWLSALPSQIERAERTTVSKTLRWAGRLVAKAVAQRSAIPLKTLTHGGGRTLVARHPGIRIRFRLPGRFGVEGATWVGASPIKASYAGDLRQQSTGARAGQHFFEGGFIATMKSGHTGIFKRRGAARLQIDEQMVPLRGVGSAVSGVQRMLPGKLTEILNQEITKQVRGR